MQVSVTVARSEAVVCMWEGAISEHMVSNVVRQGKSGCRELLALSKNSLSMNVCQEV